MVEPAGIEPASENAWLQGIYRFSPGLASRRIGSPRTGIYEASQRRSRAGPLWRRTIASPMGVTPGYGVWGLGRPDVAVFLPPDPYCGLGSKGVLEVVFGTCDCAGFLRGPPSPSTCNLGRIIPVETRAAPWCGFFLGIRSRSGKGSSGEKLGMWVMESGAQWPPAPEPPTRPIGHRTPPRPLGCREWISSEPTRGRL
jgi:hypothetical protein